MNAKTKTKVFLVDDHPIVRQGLARLLSAESDLEVCGEAEDEPTALQALHEAKPDILVVDLSLKKGSGIDLIKSVRVQFPELPVLVLTMHEESFYAERALRAGARGYLSKQEASEKILTAIRSIIKGEIYVSDRLSPKLLRRLITGSPDDDEPLISRLSDRELQVFLLIGQGRGTQEIADDLNLSVKTIETYRAHLKVKLGLKDARELVQYAIRWVLSHGPK
jgi:DNA-binding NarL/FixJ family response regulator